MCCWTCGQWLSSFEGSTRNSLIRSLESELLSRGLSFARQFLHNNTFYEYAYYLSIFLNMLIIFLFITVLYRKRPVLFKRNRPHFVLDNNGDVRDSMFSYF